MSCSSSNTYCCLMQHLCLFRFTELSLTKSCLKNFVSQYWLKLTSSCSFFAWLSVLYLFLGKINCMILMQEREVKAKHQQLISGVCFFVFLKHKLPILFHYNYYRIWFMITFPCRFPYCHTGLLHIYGTLSASYCPHLLQ